MKILLWFVRTLAFLRGGALAALWAVLWVATPPALAQTTVSYEYDALGRLIGVENSGGANDGLEVGIDYDDAGNRTRFAVGADVRAITFSISDAEVSEGGDLSFTVTKTGSASSSYSVNYATAGNSATSGTDFTAASGTLTFTSSETSKTITVSSIEDSLHESDETFYVNLSGATGGATISDSQATGTITNDDGAPSFAISDASVSEGGSLTFTVTKTGSTSSSHSVSYATAGNSATSGTDFTAASGTLTFTSSETSKTITVSSVEDSLYESDETFYVNLSGATGGATISDSQATGTITNDDDAPSFAISGGSATEGSDIVFTVTKTGSSPSSHSIDYATGNAPPESRRATAGTDYGAVSGTLTFTSSETSKTVTVATYADNDFEYDEVFLMNLSNATGGATISNDWVGGTVQDDDIPTVSISDATATEGNNLAFTVGMTGSSSFAGTVQYRVSAGTATADVDYDQPVNLVDDSDPSNFLIYSGAVLLSGGSNAQIVIPTYQDSLSEGNETVNVTLVNATTGISLIDANATGTIVNQAPPSFSISNASVSEGGSLTFTITKSGTVASSYSVNYATAGNTATSGTDFTARSGTLTFTSSQSSRTVTISSIEDSIYEGNEVFYVNLSGATGGATISDSQATGTITNDDGAPSFAINNVSVSEGGNLTFTVTKSGSTSSSHSINYATAGSSATSGTDFTAASGTLTFTSSQTSKTITVSSIEDSIYEGSEVFYVNLTGATGGATIGDSRGNGTITNDDGAPSITINNRSVSEGGNLTFTVTLNRSSSSSHSVSYATAGNTATSGTDFTARSGTITFSAGQTSKTITVSSIEDSLYEGSEVFYVNLSGATGGATISDSRGNGTITNDDSAPSFSINNVSVSEGGNLTFTVTKTGSTSSSHSINYATAGNSATSGTDFTAASGTLTFTASQSSKTITVSSIEDSIYEGSEVFYVNLTGATGGATISDSRGNGTITNDDGAPSFAINNVSVSEGGNLTFTVTKSGSTSSSHSINYATAGSSATSGTDFTAASGTLTFTSSQSSKTITVSSIEDTIYEGSEVFYVNLTGATGGATIGDSRGNGTITNDDGAPSITINNRSVSEGGSLAFTVTMNRASSASHSVSYATAGNTATSGTDFTARSGTITFSAGQTSKTITVSSIEDSLYEGSEVFYVNLSGATGGATIGDSRGNGTITNDDAAPRFSINNVSGYEGSTLTFTVRLSSASALTHSVSYATADNTASHWSDYYQSSGTLTFSPGQTSKTVPISTLRVNGTWELNETFDVNLSSATGGATISDNRGIGTIIDLDSPADQCNPICP